MIARSRRRRRVHYLERPRCPAWRERVRCACCARGLFRGGHICPDGTRRVL